METRNYSDEGIKKKQLNIFNKKEGLHFWKLSIVDIT